MSHRLKSDGVLFCVLLVFGVASRIALQGLPNVAPVAALALFGGYVWQNRLLAAALPLLVLAISDLWIGTYEGAVMASVYLALALPMLLGPYFRACRTAGSRVRLLFICTLCSSIFFYLTTNLVHWWCTPLYEPTWSGLWACYVNAIPFFRSTLIGDMAFAGLFFGSHAAVCQWVHRRHAKLTVEWT